MKGKIFSEIQFKLIVDGKKHSFWETVKNSSELTSPESFICKYKINELLYLKEPYWRNNKINRVFYRYDPESIKELRNYIPEKVIASPGFWKNKLYMPERYARYFIRIMSIENDFLENVHCKDCMEEGLPQNKCHKYIISNKQENSRVWIYEFMLIDRGIKE